VHSSPLSAAPSHRSMIECQLKEHTCNTPSKPATTPMPSSACSYLDALLSSTPGPIKTAGGHKPRRARSLPPTLTQCFRCLASDHLVTMCRDPVRCRQCLRNSHRRASCSTASQYPRWFSAPGALGVHRPGVAPPPRRAPPRHDRPLCERLGALLPSTSVWAPELHPPPPQFVDNTPTLPQLIGTTTAVLLFGSPTMFASHLPSLPSTELDALPLLSSPTVLIPHQLATPGLATLRSTCRPWT
jgi:hypothetical protein